MRPLICAALAAGVLAGPPGAQAEALRVDLVITGARVLTMDPARPVANTVVVGGGRVLFVGDEQAAAERFGNELRTRGIDGAARPGGITVLPGLIDAHAHLAGLGLALEALDLRGLGSQAEIEAKVAAAHRRIAAPVAGRDPGAEWVLGRGWDQNRFSPPQMPGHQGLDRAAPGRPVWLRRVDGHAGWASAEALRRAGITGATPEPAGGKILRDERGEPTGVLIDNAMGLVERALPPPGANSAAHLEQALLRAAEHAVRLGLTGIHDMGISPETAAAYQRLAEQRRLPLRVYAFAADPMPAALALAPDSPQYRAYLERLGEILGPPRTGPFFSLRGIKLYMDGALGSRGAALTEVYSDEPGNKGLLVSPPEHIEAMARWGMMHGYQIATHAIGDRANHLVLDAYQRAGVRADRDLRFRVEHAQVVSPADRQRFAPLGVIASMQPTHATSDMPWAAARLGPARLQWAYAWQALLGSGARLCGGSDFPVEEPAPLLGLHAAVTRRPVAGEVSYGTAEWDGQRLSVGEAVRWFTADAAYAAFEENRLGQITAGRQADLTLIGGELELDGAAPPKVPIHQREVLMTVVDGRVVFDALRKKRPRGTAP